MKATLNLIKPVEPTKTVTLELSYSEAQDLMRITNWSGKIVSVVNDLSSGTRKVKNEQSIYEIWHVLDNAGVDMES